MVKAKKATKKKIEIPKTIKVGKERFAKYGGAKTKSEAEKAADTARAKGKKVRTKKYGIKYYNFAKNK